MSAPLKCPNPSCPFLFDPSQVPPGAVLSCPRCQHQFTLNNNDPSMNPAAVEQPVPGGYAPPPENADHPFDDVSTTPADGSPREPVRKRDSGIGGTLMVLASIVLIFGLFAATGIYLLVSRSKINETSTTASQEQVVKDLNFAYKMPKENWASDETAARLKREMQVTAFVLHREKPEGWAALSVTNYKDRNPLESELTRKMIEHLSNVFQDVPTRIPGEEVQWAGQPATRYGFRLLGLATDVPYVGECYLLVHQGIAYYFYTWAAEQDVPTVAKDFDDLRNRFRLLDLRKNWRPGSASEIVLSAPESPVVLSSYENIWEKPPGLTPKDMHAQAVMVRIGKLKNRARGDFIPEAELLVLEVEKPGDAMSVADAIVREDVTPDPELFKTTMKITPQTGPIDIEAEPMIGPEWTGVTPVRLLVEPENRDISRSLRKFVVYSAIRDGDKVIIAYAKCPASERLLWENRLIQLVGSLRKR